MAKKDFQVMYAWPIKICTFLEVLLNMPAEYIISKSSYGISPSKRLGYWPIKIFNVSLCWSIKVFMVRLVGKWRCLRLAYVD